MLHDHARILAATRAGVRVMMRAMGERMHVMRAMRERMHVMHVVTRETMHVMYVMMYVVMHTMHVMTSEVETRCETRRETCA